MLVVTKSDDCLSRVCGAILAIMVFGPIFLSAGVKLFG